MSEVGYEGWLKPNNFGNTIVEESSRVEPACPKAAPLGRGETTNLN